MALPNMGVVGLLHIQPFFLPVDIQRNQAPALTLQS